MATIVLLSAAMLVTACGSSSSGDCQSDEDCPTSQRCITSGGIFFDRPVCVDTTADASPDAADCQPTNEGREICDGTDNDCDGEIDENPLHLASIAAGHGYACGTATNGDAFCWGTNTQGELGAGFTSERERRPVRVETQAEFGSIAANPNFGRQTCGLTFDGAVYCWGQSVEQFGADAGGAGSVDVPTRVPTTVDDQTIRFAALSLGGLTLCGLSEDRRVYCWGNNQSGQLGDGTMTPSTEPLRVELGGTASSVSIGIRHACATMDSGIAYCWGDNAFGQLGNGTTESPEAPVEIAAPGGASWLRLRAGDEFTCGITDRDELYCWGRDAEGQTGTDSDTRLLTPTLVETSVATDMVATGTYHACATGGEGPLECWGNLGDDGVALGTGATGSATPDSVDFDLAERSITDLEAGVLGTCLLTDQEEAYCWGSPSGASGAASADTPSPVSCPTP
ncbi:MAG: RCC1 domain-containing protein [Myxococcota bacterium]